MRILKAGGRSSRADARVSAFKLARLSRVPQAFPGKSLVARALHVSRFARVE